MFSHKTCPESSSKCQIQFAFYRDFGALVRVYTDCITFVTCSINVHKLLGANLPPSFPSCSVRSPLHHYRIHCIAKDCLYSIMCCSCNMYDSCRIADDIPCAVASRILHERDSRQTGTRLLRLDCSKKGTSLHHNFLNPPECKMSSSCASTQLQLPPRSRCN